MKLISIFLGCAAAVCSSAAGAVTFHNFSGPFAPDQWTETILGGNGFGTFAGSSSLSITSSDNGTNSATVDFTIAAPFTGIVSFDWTYLSLDVDGAAFDLFQQLLNGSVSQISSDLDGNAQSGSLSFPVTSGDVFGFRMWSDSMGSSATATITNFQFEATDLTAVPEPGSVVALGGLLGIGLTLRVRRKPAARTLEPAN